MVDGTLIEAWVSQKSFRRKDGKANRQEREGISIFTERNERTKPMN
jgi:hypothetical protein